jgi:rubrerythrin
MKYLAFALQAEREGFKNVSRLFEAIAYAETVHAHAHAKVLGMVGKTSENLQEGINGEDFEVEEMYPAYEAIAQLQEEKAALKAIRWAIEAEKSHSVLYGKAKEMVDTENDADFEDIHTCEVCGYTHVGELPDTCPVCKVKKDKFKKF